MHTNAPEGISREHLRELAKKCGLIRGYTTAEIVDSVIGYARVVLANKAVQEAFVSANQHLLKVGADDTTKELQERLVESERQRDALMEELENIATAEWRDFDPDTRRCAYEFVLWAQSRARHTINRVASGDVTKPLLEDKQ